MENLTKILLQARNCDTTGRFLEAQTLYSDGIKALKTMMETQGLDQRKRKAFQERLDEYEARVEQIQERLDRQLHSEGLHIAHRSIEEGSTGHSYQSLFGRFLDSAVKEVVLEEPYLHIHSHFINFVKFLETLVHNCRNLKYVRVLTKQDLSNADQQQQNFEQIIQNMCDRGIRLSVEYLQTLHDRKIVLSSGYIIKIGLGLHFFMKSPNKFALGMCDFNFRRCKQTEFDVIRIEALRG